MFETIINLKPKSEWRTGVTIERSRPRWTRHCSSPAFDAWTMPIRARIDMLATGIRTPVGIKVFGSDLTEMEKAARQVEAVVRNVPGTASAYAERVIGGYYLDIVPDRIALGRYGLMVGDVQDVIATALGGETVTHDRRGPRALHRKHPLSPRAARPQSIASEVQVPLPAGGTVPLGEVAEVKLTRARPPSARRTASLRSTSSSISETATSAATSRMRARRWQTR